MSDELQQLKSVMDAMRGELDEMKATLRKLGRVVSFDTDDQGVEHTYIECSDFIVRPLSGRRHLAVHIGSTEDGGYIDLHYPGEEHASKAAISLAMHADGEPHIQVRGKDWKARADMFIQKDHGVVAVLGPNDARGAVMRALPGGGSVAVLQPDGLTRAVLIHNEQHQFPGSDVAAPSTDLIFANASRETLLKLHSDGQLGMLSATSPGKLDGVMITTSENGPAIMLRGVDDATSINMIAGKEMARLSVHQGWLAKDQAEASLAAGNFGSSMELRECDGSKRVDISAMKDAATVVLSDSKGVDAVALSHFSDSHSSLAMHGTADHDCVRIIANKDAALLRLSSPNNADTEITTAIYEEKPTMIMRQDKVPLVLAGHAEHGGTVCAYGRQEVQGGIASLSGGPLSGVLSISARDGTQLMTLDGTDHGGRLLINNDLGFQRVVMGVHQEAATLVLNNTGSNGVIATAMPGGGVLSVCDAEGRVVRVISGKDDDDDDSKNWGKLPGGG